MNTPRSWISTGLFPVSLLAATVICILALAALNGVFAASPAGGINLVAIDMDSAGNTATSIGNTDGCVSVAANAEFTVDVVVDKVPAVSGGAGGLAGFQVTVLYDPAKINVTAYNINMMMASSGGSNVLDFTTPPGADGGDIPQDDIPEGMDGSFAVGAADFGTTTENGVGVLARVTLKAVGNGTDTIGILSGQQPNGDPNLFINDSANNQYDITEARAGTVVIGGACPEPTPSPTPSPTPAGEARKWGDGDCNNVVDSIDALKTSRFVANLSVNQVEPCPSINGNVDVAFGSLHKWGDVDCNGVVDAIDALKILRSVANLSVNQTQPCFLIGSNVTVAEQ
jgi:hypothetical protein